eukprot:12415547-Karenia_brevis.AAC.1
MWTFPTAGNVAPSLFDALAKMSGARLKRLTARESTNTVWDDAANRRDLANAVRSLCYSGHASPALFAKVAVWSKAQLKDFNPQELESTVSACDAGHAHQYSLMR